MAAPRVFLSSTYYDLKQLRNDIGNFVESLGYQVVMHERSDVAYSHDQPLENDCYSELSACDIVVCIIGNSFGTKSSANELSITMNELKAALKARKIVYVFVAKDVWIEQRTYLKNKDNPNFVPAAVNDIKIHQYIEALNQTVGNVQPIVQFETADDIIYTLKAQFAGLFQALLSRRIGLSERDNLLELHEEVDSLRKIISDTKDAQRDFWERFESTVLIRNPLAVRIESAFGFFKSHILLKDIWAVDELAVALGCDVLSPDGEEIVVKEGELRPVSGRIYRISSTGRTITVTVDAKCFNDDGTLKVFNKTKSDELVKFESADKPDDGMPF